MIGIFEGIEIGGWYRAPGGGEFEVVALDFDAETIEVQYYDGDIAELDYDSWLELGARPISRPNDSNAAFDLNVEDYADLPGHDPLGNPLDVLDWR